MIKRYGIWYFDTKDVVVIADESLAEGDKSYKVYLRQTPTPFSLRGQAAKDCLVDFLREREGG